MELIIQQNVITYTVYPSMNTAIRWQICQNM